jgi:sarcosine oxidase subunit gamma
MPEPARSAPLAGFAAAGQDVPGPRPVSLEVLPFRGKLMLRGGEDVRRRAAPALGFPLPELLASAESEGVRAFGLGPDAWLLIVVPGSLAAVTARLREALVGTHHALVEVSDRLTGLAVDGARSREVLNAGCPLDLHPRAFPAGRVVRTLLGKATVVIDHPAEDDRFELLVDGTFAPYAWQFLENAAREHGYRVRA